MDIGVGGGGDIDDKLDQRERNSLEPTYHTHTPPLHIFPTITLFTYTHTPPYYPDPYAGA